MKILGTAVLLFWGTVATVWPKPFYGRDCIVTLGTGFEFTILGSRFPDGCKLMHRGDFVRLEYQTIPAHCQEDQCWPPLYVMTKLLEHHR